jgi:2-dehydro-3-deoxyphosphooctonate aldolase (KDO 8-P synthase)
MFYKNLKKSNDLSFVIGLNVLDEYSIVNEVCRELDILRKELGFNFIFKASWDKANRSSMHSYRGLGLNKSLSIFEKVKSDFGFEILTDVHERGQCDLLKDVIDVFQLPAFLSRQTDLVEDLAKSNKPINIKKAQFLAPDQMGNILNKFSEFGNDKLILCERGTMFGYNNLVVDFLGLDLMRKSFDVPLLLDVTHALQIRDSGSEASGGRSGQAMSLAFAASSVGVNGLFLEVHPDPKFAKCDGPSATSLSELKEILVGCIALRTTLNSL